MRKAFCFIDLTMSVSELCPVPFKGENTQRGILLWFQGEKRIIDVRILEIIPIPYITAYGRLLLNKVFQEVAGC